jgi:hypothetical protein
MRTQAQAKADRRALWLDIPHGRGALASVRLMLLVPGGRPRGQGRARARSLVLAGKHLSFGRGTDGAREPMREGRDVGA